MDAITAADIMSSPVVTVTANATAQQAACILTHHNVSVAPVVSDDGVLLGIVSESDLIIGLHRTVSEVMTTAVISVSADSPVSDVRHLLIDRRIRCVPVMAQGRPVGIVSLHDVLALLATEWACRVCGEPVRGDAPPSQCPRCHASSDQFEIQEQSPGA